MAGNRVDMSDYVEVNERIMAFKAAHPDGSLQAEIHTLTDSLVVMKAYAYRTPGDERPGTGWSSLGIPGATPFTKGSEIENCETSAWGRAIAALGFEVKRGIASKQEVENKSRAKHSEPEKPSNGSLLREALQAGAVPQCGIHHVDLQLSKTGKWGHLLEDRTACVQEVI